MKIKAQLDHPTILANQGCPVHLALELQAPFAEAGERRPMAFCAILDRSGSMAGRPLAQAKAACEGIIRNLRASDQFALVAFDDTAQVVLPMSTIRDKTKAIEVVRRIHDMGSTNLCAGWMLGRDELRKTAEGTARRTMLLSDGMLNRGIVNRAEVARIVTDGLERSHIRTSTLGFGDCYEENLLETLATDSGGNFYDANSPEKLPSIFESELDGLQRTACQNVRIRVRKLDFCESWILYAAFRSVQLPDGRVEISLGDLISDESATLVFHLDVLPLPLLPDGTAAATLEGECLLELEILWDDLTSPSLASRTHLQTIRILQTQNPAEIRLNEDVIPAVATQCAGLAVDKATHAANDNNVQEAILILKKALEKIRSFGNEAKAADGIHALESLLQTLQIHGGLDARSSKASKFRSSHMRKMKSMSMWTINEQAPSYSKKSTPRNPPEGGGEEP